MTIALAAMVATAAIVAAPAPVVSMTVVILGPVLLMVVSLVLLSEAKRCFRCQQGLSWAGGTRAEFVAEVRPIDNFSIKNYMTRRVSNVRRRI